MYSTVRIALIVPPLVHILPLPMKQALNRFILGFPILFLKQYPYAWIAVVFEDWITSSPIVLANFQLTGATVMTAIGAFSLRPLTRSRSA